MCSICSYSCKKLYIPTGISSYFIFTRPDHLWGLLQVIRNVVATALQASDVRVPKKSFLRFFKKHFSGSIRSIWRIVEKHFRNVKAHHDLVNVYYSYCRYRAQRRISWATIPRRYCVHRDISSSCDTGLVLSGVFRTCQLSKYKGV
jgi:hypothetical protein